jgi:YfiH family protein
MDGSLVPALHVPHLVAGFEARLAGARGLERQIGRARVAQALAPFGRTFFLTQVHGASVVRAPWQGAPEGDAGLSAAAGHLVAIETADCLPILLVEPTSRLAAAVHAGWRGTAAGIVTHAVEALISAGGRPSRLRAVLGPGIGVCCYEVGGELREALAPRHAAHFRPGSRDREHFDLRGANAAQLIAAGLMPQNIEDLAVCTFCDPRGLPSYRRQGPRCGRIVSYVGWRTVEPQRAGETSGLED